MEQYSGILPDLAGFTTANDTAGDIAKKIAAAVLVDGPGFPPDIGMPKIEPL